MPDSVQATREPRPATTLFTPVRPRRLTLPNRIAVAPMTRVSATAGGHATDRMRDYYAAFARGGFGLVISEGTYTDKAFSQGYLHQPGLADDAQAAAWAPVVAAVHAGGSPMLAQLMHAGALSQGNLHRPHTVGPSAVQPVGLQMTNYRGSGPYPVPAAMTEREIDEAVAGFAAAAARARGAGFDGVEVHAANGYLLDEFLTAGVNVREDAYGGPARNRVKLLVEVVAAVRAATGPGFLVGVRISQGKVNDFGHRWAGAEDDARVIFSAFAGRDIDYVHTADAGKAWLPAFPGGGASFAALAKRHSGLPVIANGSLDDPARAAAFVADGNADVVALARGALAASDWPERVRQGLPIPAFDPATLQPIADLANADSRRRG